MLVPIIICCDQLVKHGIRTGFDVGESLPVIEDVFHITYVRNTGAAFSMFAGSGILTIALPIVITIACLVMIIIMYRRDEVFLMFAIGLIISGGVGNLIDRICFGYVTDMMDFRIFPVFNVADIAITCGCGLIIIWAIFMDERDEVNNHEESDE